MKQYLLYALYAFLILLALGLILGAVLVWAEKVFHVEEDKRIADVEKMLPNCNCGACGHAGCHSMAESIVSGEQKNKNFDPIIKYMEEHPDADGTKHIPTI